MHFDACILHLLIRIALHQHCVVGSSSTHVSLNHLTCTRLPGAIVKTKIKQTSSVSYVRSQTHTKSVTLCSTNNLRYKWRLEGLGASKTKNLTCACTNSESDDHRPQEIYIYNLKGKGIVANLSPFHSMNEGGAMCPAPFKPDDGRLEATPETLLAQDDI